MSRRPPSRFLLWAVLVVVGILWGATFVLTIMALDRGDHPVGISFWQTVLGAAMVIAYNIARGKPGFPTGRRYLAFYVTCGILGTALPTVLFLYAAEHVSAGVLSISTATVPMTTFALAAAIRLEAFSWLRTTGLVAGFGAILMLTVPDTGLPDPALWPWVLVSVVAASSYAMENVVIGRFLPKGEDPFVILSGMLTAATLLLAGVMAGMGAYSVPAWPPQKVEWAVILMAAIYVVAYGMFIYLIDAAGPVFASQIGYVVTLSGIAWGMIVFGESHSVWFWGAVALMMAGLTLVRPKEDEPPVAAHPGDHLVDVAGRDGEP